MSSQQSVFCVSSDGPSRGSQPAKRRGLKTPKKSKRMAARFDGHSSAEVDTSRSVTDRLVMICYQLYFLWKTQFVI